MDGQIGPFLWARSVPQQILHFYEKRSVGAPFASREEELLLDLIPVTVTLYQVRLLEVVIVSQVEDRSSVHPIVEENVEVEGVILRIDLRDVSHSQPICELEGRGRSKDPNVEDLTIVVGGVGKASTLQTEAGLKSI